MIWIYSYRAITSHISEVRTIYPVVNQIYIWKPPTVPTAHIHSAFTGPESGVPLVKPIC